jgi:hypothetical protein
MIDDDEQETFDAARRYVADTISTLADDGPHPSLVYAAILSEISCKISAADFWGTEKPNHGDFGGYWNVMWRLREKAFAELEAD